MVRYPRSYVVILASNERVARRLLARVPFSIHLDWSELYPRLRSVHPPAALLLTTCAITPFSVRALRGAHMEARLPLVAVYCEERYEDMEKVLWLSDIAPLMIRADEDPLEKLRQADDALSAKPLLGRLYELFPEAPPLARRFLDELVHMPGALRLPLPELAGLLSVSAPSLRRVLREAKMPSPQELRNLVRLHVASDMIHRRSRSEAAAQAVGLAGERGLRQALDRLEFSVSDLRKAYAPEDMVQRWIERLRQSTPEMGG